MELTNLKVGVLETNCFIIADGEECMIIDPGSNADKILEAVGDLKIKYIVLTHYHWDHTGALPELVEKTGATVVAHKIDAPRVYSVSQGFKIPRSFKEAHARAIEKGFKVDEEVEDGDVLFVGSCVFRVIHTPGHTAGSMCLHCAEENLLFAGDTLFSQGRFGRTDFEDGSMEAMVNTLETKFLDVDDNVVVFSGHEGNSTMARERALNPYLK